MKPSKPQPTPHDQIQYFALLPTGWRDIGTMQLASAKRKAKSLGAVALAWTPKWGYQRIVVKSY